MARTTTHGAKATGQEWRDRYGTPQAIKDAVSACYGHDQWYDPAPSNRGEHWTRYFDGLKATWGTQSFCNPPFSKYLTWVEYGLHQFHYGYQAEQIWIMHHDSSTQRFKRLAAEASAICLLSERVSFLAPIPFRQGGTDIAKSQSIIYLGHRAMEFNDAFAALGTVLFT